MAAGKFFVYNTAAKYLAQQKIDWEGGTIKAMAVHSGYTFSTASDSALAQVTSYQASASSTVVNAVTVSTCVITGSGAEVVKFDCANIDGISAGGDSFKAKYIIFYAESASADGVDNLLIGGFTTDSSTTGVEGTQINVTVPSGGLFKIKTNQ